MIARLGRIAVPILGLALAAAGLSGCRDKSGQGGFTFAVANPCGAKVTPDRTATLPMDPGSNETDVDCSAWQSFIALNWAANPDPAKAGTPDPARSWDSFGTPGDMSPKVWESYREASAVFGDSGPLKGQWFAKRPAVKSLVKISKLGDVDLSDVDQAGGGGHWLTNQRGEVTYYEVMMNRDEFEFITQAGFDLTTADGQAKCAAQAGKVIFDGPPPPPKGPLRGGLNMPAGFGDGWSDTDCTGKRHAFGDNVGAMEIKAAWTVLPADHSLDYRYKTAIAEVRDPASAKMRQVTVGLVGLHIARKRFPRLPWVWATFEHIDNTPDEAAGGGFAPPRLPDNPNQMPAPGFTFFDPKCTLAKDPSYKCVHNPLPKACAVGAPAGSCMPYGAPMQITRLNPVRAAANGVTAYVWSLLPPKSVFNYYRLVGVQWPQANIGTPPGPGLHVPLTQGSPMPKGKVGGTGQILANTTLESFEQASHSCMDCHANFAAIASAPGGAKKVVKLAKGQVAPYAADYSFIFLAETKR